MPGAPSALWCYVFSEIFQLSSINPTENLTVLICMRMILGLVSAQTPPWGAASLSSSSQVGHREPVKFEPGTCQVRAWNLSSSSLKLVKFEPGTCQVRAWNLSSSSMDFVTFQPGVCQVQAWNLSGSSLISWLVQI